MIGKETTGGINLLHDLSISHKENRIWTSSFKSSKSFVREALNLSDEIWSLAGYGKLYKSKDM